MQIAFFKTSKNQKLQWELIHNGMSALTGEKAFSHLGAEDCIVCVENTFFLDPATSTKVPYGRIPSSPESALSWLIKSGFFNPYWILRILLGSEDTLRTACKRCKAKFPQDIRALMMGHSVRNTLEQELEFLRSQEGDLSWRAQVEGGTKDIQYYHNKQGINKLDSRFKVNEEP